MQSVSIAILGSNFKLKFSVSKLLQEIDRAKHNGSILSILVGASTVYDYNNYYLYLLEHSSKKVISIL